MNTKTIEVFQFNELSDDAKETARNWYRAGMELDSEWAWESALDDAKEIGLIIESLDQHRTNKGRFAESAEATAHLIVDNHGASCDTYQTAKRYLEDRDEAIETAPTDDDGEFEDERELDDVLDDLDEEFLQSLLGDYYSMYEKDLEYQSSDEVIDENITANEYEFTEDGERFRY